ncbi:hypothetical protein [Pseudomonas oryzihabitans]|uniref:Uncharacterized protein n=1 Tax=Pseudomonas oryzihabitans TaxID=47885 RepID=A0AAJ2BI22_9PSED|nr:hypothetical protein [Pseudomonas psychrotolerans]MDR6234664.1 hypothetical protein [Pseudomonas psychrotolerans]MDR6356181.1 hypothetical protein [Pseudomonas psychrotolerans]
MEETRIARADRDVPSADLTTETSPGKPEPAPNPAIPLPELDRTLDGIEITRLPWGYAVTRTTSTS